MKCTATYLMVVCQNTNFCIYQFLFCFFFTTAELVNSSPSSSASASVEDGCHNTPSCSSSVSSYFGQGCLIFCMSKFLPLFVNLSDHFYYRANLFCPNCRFLPPFSHFRGSLLCCIVCFRVSFCNCLLMIVLCPKI